MTVLLRLLLRSSSRKGSNFSSRTCTGARVKGSKRSRVEGLMGQGAEVYGMRTTGIRFKCIYAMNSRQLHTTQDVCSIHTGREAAKDARHV